MKQARTRTLVAHNWIAHAALLGLGTLFAVNALVLQGDKHPAPLISGVAMPENAREIRLVSTGPGVSQSAENPLVEAVQTELKALGFYEGGIDGVLGEQTREAILTYEMANGLPASGKATAALVSHIRLANEMATSQDLQTGPTAAATEEARDAIAALISRDGMSDDLVLSAPPSADEEAVRTLQFKLRQLGYDPGPIDGKFGSATERALRAFQQAHGMEVTGRADDAVMQKLFAVAGERRSTGG